MNGEIENLSKEIKTSTIGISLRKKKMDKLLNSDFKILNNDENESKSILNSNFVPEINLDITSFIIQIHNQYQIDLNGLLLNEENHTNKLNYCLNSENFDEFLYSVYIIKQCWSSSEKFIGISDYILEIFLKRLYDYYISNSFNKSIVYFILSCILLIIDKCKQQVCYEYVFINCNYVINYLSANLKDELLYVYMKVLTSLIKNNLTLSNLILDSFKDLAIFHNAITFIKQTENNDTKFTNNENLSNSYSNNNRNNNCDNFQDCKTIYLRFLLAILRFKELQKDMFDKILSHIFYFIDPLLKSFLSSIEDVKNCSISDIKINYQLGITNDQYVSIFSKNNMSITNIVPIDAKTNKNLYDLFYSVLCLFKLTEVKNQEIYLSKNQNQIILTMLSTYKHYFTIHSILETYYDNFSDEFFFENKFNKWNANDIKNHMDSLNLLNDILINVFKFLVNVSSFSYKSIKQNFFNGIFDIILDILNDEMFLKSSFIINNKIVTYILIILSNHFNDSYEINNLSQNSIYTIYKIYNCIIIELNYQNNFEKIESLKSLLKEVYYCIFNYITVQVATNIQCIYENQIVSVKNLTMNFVEYNFKDTVLNKIFIKSVIKILQYEEEFEEEDEYRKYLAINGFKEIIENITNDSDLVENIDILLREDITMNY